MITANHERQQLNIHYLFIYLFILVFLLCFGFGRKFNVSPPQTTDDVHVKSAFSDSTLVLNLYGL